MFCHRTQKNVQDLCRLLQERVVEGGACVDYFVTAMNYLSEAQSPEVCEVTTVPSVCVDRPLCPVYVWIDHCAQCVCG